MPRRPLERRPARFLGVSVERLDDRLLLTAVTVLSATEADFQTLAISYNVQPSDVGSLVVKAYRGATATFDPTTDEAIGSFTLNGASVTPGEHDRVAIPLTTALGNGASALSPDPSRPFVFAAITGPDAATSSASFQKIVVGVVTHGFESPLDTTGTLPAWVQTMANTLTADGYKNVIPFDWVIDSGKLQPGEATAAGMRVASQVQQYLATPGNVPAGAVVDLHFIGHSRGTVVVNQAFQTLQDSLPPGSPARAGYWRETLLDPHPAHGTDVVPFTVTSGSAGRAALFLANIIQNADQDPFPLNVPSMVAEVQDYFEHSPTSNAPYFDEEGIINPLGTNPPDGVVAAPGAATQVHALDLTTPGIVHGVVHDWYQVNVAPKLSAATPFVNGPVDAPIFATAYNIDAVAGLNLPHLVAGVTTDNPNSSASDLTATIQWGDGTQSTGSVYGGPLVGYYVTGSHTYSAKGTFRTVVTVTDVGGSAATSAGTATVYGFSTTATGAAPGSDPIVTIRRDDTGAVTDSFFAYDASYRGGVNAVSADVNGDGVPDIVVAPASGGNLPVKVFSGKDHHLIVSFFPTRLNTRRGLLLSAGDVEGAGRADIVLSDGRTTRIYTKDGVLVDTVRARVVATQDVNGDGVADLVVRSGSGSNRRTIDGLSLKRTRVSHSLAQWRKNLVRATLSGARRSRLLH